MDIFINVVLLFIGLLFLTELFSRSKALTWIFFLTVPFALIPLWIDSGYMDAFLWVKVYSVVAAILLFNGLRHTGLGRQRWLYYLVYGILALNILEAVVNDLRTVDTASILNAISGILLIVSLTDTRSIYVRDNRHRDLCTPQLNLWWVIWYTIWNWLYVYYTYPEVSLRHVAVLGAALVFSLFRKEAWEQARAYTLGLYLIYSFTFESTLTRYDRVLTVNDTFATGTAIAGLVFMLIYVYTRYGARIRQATYADGKQSA